MNIFNSLRNKSFWLLDAIKGGVIKNHYRSIKFINENPSSNRATKLTEKYLTDLINHSLKTTPYYKNLTTGVKHLKDFPVINKDIVRNNYENFKSSLYSNKKNSAVFTGGSTGTPFKLFHNTNKRKRHFADNIYYAEKGGYALGDRLYLLRAIHKKDINSTFLFLKKNMRPYGIASYTSNDMERLLYDLKKDKTQKCIVCFASMCDILVHFLDSTGKKPLEKLNIKSIVTDGDSLSKVTKDKMENYFKTPTIARYGNMECGIMGQQEYTGGYNYSLNLASYYFELLDLYEDKPAKPGELGRIVVTDLFNYCMPLLRYDTGDLAISFDDPKNLVSFSRIEGRKVDLIYDTKERVVSPYTIIQMLYEYFELKQFQFIQKGKKEYVFKLNPWKEFTKEKQLISETKTYLGEDADIIIEYVDEVPLLSSGKRKQVLSEI